MTEIEKRQLGPLGPLTTPLGLGSWHTWSRMPFEEAVQLVREAIDGGVNLFDVAYYNMGPHPDDSPTDLIWAKAVREAGVRREQFVYSAKLWLWDYPAQDFTSQLVTALRRTGYEKADTAIIGDYMSIDIPAVMNDVAAQIDAGRLGSWGVNNWPFVDFHAARVYCAEHGLPQPTFVQLKYGIARRAMAEGEYYGELFREGTVVLQASDVFEGGILAGKPDTARQIGADPGGIREQIRRIVPEVERVAAGFGATPAQLGIAFCLSNPAVANVLFGASRLAQLRENLGALELWRNHGDEVRRAVAELQVDREVAADGVWRPVPAAE